MTVNILELINTKYSSGPAISKMWPVIFVLLKLPDILRILSRI